MFEKIPDSMKLLPQWVCVKADSKAPLDAKTGYAASSTNPTTWSDYTTALRTVEQGYADNLGFVFNDNGFVGIDVDIGYDEDGFLTPVAADILGKCQSYTERSRSGRGFHILLRGTLPFKGRNNLNGVEIYRSSRYFIMTGDAIVYHTLRENQEAIDYVVKTYFPEAKRDENSKPMGNRVYTPIWEKPVGSRIKLRPVYPRIPNGCRNICLTSLAGMLHNQGYSKAQIYDELIYCNTVACDPELPRNELQTIVNSVTRYKR